MRQTFYWQALGALFLSSVHAAPTDIPSAASFYVPSLPDIHQDPAHPLKIFAGHISSDPFAKNAADTDVTAHLYFVMVKNRRTADKQRVVFWFNGGPGCSSFDGLMMENGPWRMDGKGGFQVQEGGWEEYTTMVYVDQPAGTGFSYTSTDKFVHNFQQASDQFLQFLKNFYKIFPNTNTSMYVTYLAGESYAGQYIPFFADAILNSKVAPLKGVAIGNGWIDARSQYPSYIDYLVKTEVLEENSDFWKSARQKTDECLELLKGITDREPTDNEEMCINIYDIRLDDTYPACGMNWPPDIKPVTTYLDRDDVVRALHAQDHSAKWIECRGRVHSELKEKTLNSSITILPSIIERIPVLIFAGDQDIICNYVGLESMIAGMTWNGETGLGTVQTQSWSVNEKSAGTWVESRNLTYAKIFDSSHMVPFDVPHVAHDMMLRFMGVDFSQVFGGSARIPSSVGDKTKPMYTDATAIALPTSTKTPQQDKAMWEAYYNAGSAALVLVVIALFIGLFVCWRVRRRKSLRLPMNNKEENVPLNTSMTNFDDTREDEEAYGNSGRRPRAMSVKGKERAFDRSPSPQPPIFDDYRKEDR
ncbi:alpha/beta-hydrolase [Hymenopellis radicata]|nr:alpha/beta-hydrolase [Hymenopellis radicata]